MANTNATNEMNGSVGGLKIDGIEYANISSFDAKVTLNREDMQFSGNLGMDSKILSSTGAGSMTFKKINSRVVARHLPTILTGKEFKMVLILTVDDPDGLGAETISITDVWLNDFDLLKFEIGAVIEEDISFGFNPTNIIPLDIVAE